MMPSPCRILVVDDDKDSCELIKAMLHFSDLDYEVAAANSSKEAISLMGKQSFDLFMIDYSLPEISGLELCRYIRENDPITPITFLTARAFPQDRINALTAGANEYLVKPNDLSKLVDTVNRLLNENPLADCETPYKSKANIGIY